LFILSLTAQIDTNFGSPVDQQTQGVSQPVSVKRIRTPSSVDKVRHTPEGLQPAGGAMTPSPGSYSMTYPSQNKVPTPRASSNSLYSPISPRGQVHKSGPAISNQNRSSVGQQSYMQNAVPQGGQLSGVSSGNIPMSPNDMSALSNGNITQQQLRQLQQQRRMMTSELSL